MIVSGRFRWFLKTVSPMFNPDQDPERRVPAVRLSSERERRALQQVPATAAMPQMDSPRGLDAAAKRHAATRTFDGPCGGAGRLPPGFFAGMRPHRCDEPMRAIDNLISDLQ